MSHNIALSNIQFPVFIIGSTEPIIDGPVSYLLSGTDTKYSDAQYKISVIDDKDVEGDTLAMRRLRLRAQGVTLKKLTKAVFFLSDFIKIAKSKIWFIDALGTIFKYVKTKTVPLMYKKVKSIHKMPQGGAIVEIEGIPSRFKTLFVPSSTLEWAGVLKDGPTFIFYGLYDKKYKDSVRRI